MSTNKTGTLIARRELCNGHDMHINDGKIDSQYTYVDMGNSTIWLKETSEGPRQITDPAIVGQLTAYFVRHALMQAQLVQVSTGNAAPRIPSVDDIYTPDQ